LSAEGEERYAGYSDLRRLRATDRIAELKATR
jgi:hypothetical protein